MLMAGSLRYQGIGYTQTLTQSSVTGAKKKTNTQLGIFRFFRQTHKEQAALIGKEETKTGTLIMQCRKGPITTQMTHFKYDGQMYKVIQRLPDAAHNSYDITATLINE